MFDVFKGYSPCPHSQIASPAGARAGFEWAGSLSGFCRVLVLPCPRFAVSSLCRVLVPPCPRSAVSSFCQSTVLVNPQRGAGEKRHADNIMNIRDFMLPIYFEFIKLKCAIKA